MKILIFGGFLGAGKTTAITQMVKYLTAEDPSAAAKAVLLENEIGDTGIDDKTLVGTGMRVETLFSGCICCTMAGEMIENIRTISRKFSPEWLILETTGMAYPGKIKENIREHFPETECLLMCLVDAKRWRRMQKVPELRQFSLDQLEDADVILINKRDLVSAGEMEEIDQSVREISRYASLYHVAARDGIENEVWEKIFSERLR